MVCIKQFNGEANMWWGWHRHQPNRHWNWLPFFLIFLGFVLWSGGGRSWFMWMILFFFVIPFVRSLVASGWSQQGDYEKRKRETGDVVIIDKPKREPQYAVGDDGELVEVYNDDTYEEKPKRLRSANDGFDSI
jgi:hypothetical protein